MGHVLDLVPNHMGIAKSANPWWQDVLENGPSSRFAHFFDIEWHPVKDELADKAADSDSRRSVRRGRSSVRNCGSRTTDGAFVVRYYDNVLPIAPEHFRPSSASDLDAWLARPRRRATPTSCRAS